ncbi:MAG: YbaB/EbfC family nucleoid-associated protein [Methylocystaceae bacterium]
MAKGGFGNFGGGNMNQMMKQAQKLQEQMNQVQANLVNMTVEATSGGGMVYVKVNGRQEIMELKIKSEAVDPEDVEMLQDMVLTAVNEGLKKAADMANEAMGKITGGLNLPF